MDEIKTLLEANKNEEDSNRRSLAQQIRTFFNDKIIEYDNVMESKTKEKEDNKVKIYRILYDLF